MPPTELEALHRSATGLIRGTEPTMRQLLMELEIPRTYLLPEADVPLPGTPELAAAALA